MRRNILFKGFSTDKLIKHNIMIVACNSKDVDYIACPIKFNVNLEYLIKDLLLMVNNVYVYSKCPDEG